MARRLSIGTILATAIAVSLAAAAALPAVAHHREGHDGGRGQGQSQAEDGEKGQGQASGRGQSGGNGQTSGQGQSKGKDQGQASGQSQSKGKDQGQASGQDQSEGKGSARGKGQAQASGQGQRARGTVKIRSTGVKDGDRRNEPHPGCEFWVHYWGFDEREAVATFRAHPPTGGNRDVLETDTVDVGPDQVMSGPYNLEPAFQALGIEPHHKQGYHVKLQTTSTDGRHLTKHKVFWIDCPAPQVLAEEIEPEELVPPEDEVIGEEILLEEREAVPPEDEVLGIIHERVRPEVRDVHVTAAPQEKEPEEEVRPGVLPVTGASLLIFLLAGLALIGAGANLYRARRR